MIKKLFLTVACFISLTAMAQNLIANGDFENYSALPNTWGQLEQATGWSNLNTGNTFPFATPDYLHTMGSGEASLPDSYFGTVNPYSGSGIVGFITYNIFVSNFREYLSTQLGNPMQKDSTYTISFWLSNGSANWYGKSSSNHIGIRFSTQSLVQNQHEPVGGVPQIEIPGQAWSTLWQNYSFTFTADSNYNFFTLGNFYNDISTIVTDQASSGNSSLAYYFVDKIEIYKTSTVPVLLNSFYATKVDKKVVVDWTMLQEINSKEFVVERSTDQISFNSIGSRSGAGNSVNPNYYSLTDNSPSEGINYYRLKMIDADGRYNYSIIRKVRISSNSSLVVTPNPVEESFNVKISSKLNATGKLTIFDLAGKAIYKRDLSLKMGVNQIPLVVTGLAKGEYILQILINDELQSTKIIRR